PNELYESPRYLDVAEFMGFRNRLAGRVVRVDGGRATLSVAGAELTGRAMDGLKPGDAAVLAARGDDVEESAGGAGNTVPAVVEAVEYRGREYVGTARSQDGIALVFHGPRPLERGAQVPLAIDAGR